MMEVDHDNAMYDVQNENQVQDISDYVTTHRFSDLSSVSMEEIDSGIPVMELTSTQTIFVVDTNFIVSHLNTLEGLRQLSSQLHHKIVIPNTVFRELDGLKRSDRLSTWITPTGESKEITIGTLARWANNWIYTNLANSNSGIIGQKLRQRVNKDCSQDDAILDCCLHFKDVLNCFVILLSNDKNLCLKSLAEEVLTVSYVPEMTAELIATKAYYENVQRYGYSNNSQPTGTIPNASIPTIEEDDIRIDDVVPDIQSLDINETSPYIFEEITKTLKTLLDDVMKETYGSELDLIDYERDRIINLVDCAKCLRKFWLSVFSEYFRGAKLHQSSWKDLPKVLTTMPNELNDLMIFNSFWQDIIRHLFSKKSKEEKLHFTQILDDWNNIVRRSK